MADPGSFAYFEREHGGIEIKVLSEENLTHFRLLTHDDFLKLREYKFEEYFNSCGLQVLYAVVKLKEGLSRPIPLGKLEEVSRLTIGVMGMADALGRLKDRSGGCPKEEDIVSPFAKALVEEGLLRGLL